MADRSGISSTDFEQLSRYLDGELDIVATDNLEARLEHDAALRAELETLRANDSLVRALFQTGAATRIPAPATVSLAQGDNVFALSNRKRFAPFAAAATIALGVSAVLLQTGGAPSTRAPGMDQLLAEALETTPSRAEGWDTLADGAALRAVLTFPAADGRWCREFLVASDAKHWRGVACRDDNTWVTQVMGSEVFLEQETQYRTASADDDQAVARFIDETASDVALGPDEEAALLNSGWER